MRLVFLIGILLYSCTEKQSGFSEANADPFDSVLFPDSPGTNSTPGDFPFAEFIPDSFSILDSLPGELNGDGYADMLLILKSPYEGVESNVPRPLLILFGTENNTYKLSARNDSVVLSADEGGIFGDPYQEMSTGDKTFSVIHMGGSAWRWVRQIAFSYSAEEDKWYLDGDGGSSFHISNPDSAEVFDVHPEDWKRLPFVEYSKDK
jgi:hypothetical protein